ncbi:hypothetical protein JB92DRAFT_3104689 [Gautieria morchelliformis]|nr:hypothetical protein JB92DRAFT_3104689 [Gautieria morchelliformis]
MRAQCPHTKKGWDYLSGLGLRDPPCVGAPATPQPTGLRAGNSHPMPVTPQPYNLHFTCTPTKRYDDWTCTVAPQYSPGEASQHVVVDPALLAMDARSGVSNDSQAENVTGELQGPLAPSTPSTPQGPVGLRLTPVPYLSPIGILPPSSPPPSSSPAANRVRVSGRNPAYGEVDGLMRGYSPWGEPAHAWPVPVSNHTLDQAVPCTHPLKPTQTDANKRAARFGHLVVDLAIRVHPALNSRPAPH